MLGYGALIRWSARLGGEDAQARRRRFAAACSIGWCGMRGLVTLAAAFALPAGFPGRDPIVLAAFCVVLGTLVLQGMTLKPLLRLLSFDPDETIDREVAQARVAIMQAALDVLSGKTSNAAAAVREQYKAQRTIAENPDDAQAATEYDRLRLYAIKSQRDALERLRTRRDDRRRSLPPAGGRNRLGGTGASPAGRFQPLTTSGGILLAYPLRPAAHCNASPNRYCHHEIEPDKQ